jgi:hypothetical protein
VQGSFRRHVICSAHCDVLQAELAQRHGFITLPLKVYERTSPLARPSHSNIQGLYHKCYKQVPEGVKTPFCINMQTCIAEPGKRAQVASVEMLQASPATLPHEVTSTGLSVA